MMTWDHHDIVHDDMYNADLVSLVVLSLISTETVSCKVYTDSWYFLQVQGKQHCVDKINHVEWALML